MCRLDIYEIWISPCAKKGEDAIDFLTNLSRMGQRGRGRWGLRWVIMHGHAWKKWRLILFYYKSWIWVSFFFHFCFFFRLNNLYWSVFLCLPIVSSVSSNMLLSSSSEIFISVFFLSTWNLHLVPFKKYFVSLMIFLFDESLSSCFPLKTASLVLWAYL